MNKHSVLAAIKDIHNKLSCVQNQLSELQFSIQDDTYQYQDWQEVCCDWNVLETSVINLSNEINRS